MVDRIRFYTDEHLPLTVAAGLERRGVDALTVRDAGRLGGDDDSQLRFATEEGRVLVTCDDDFLRLHGAMADHAGIVFVPRERSVSEMIAGLMLVWQVLTPDEMRRHVEFL